MGSSKKPEQQVADYMMSIHFGVCHQADSIERIKINDKAAFQGNQSSNGTLSIDLPNLCGGNKKEGGARGLIEVLMGAADQVLPTRLAAKLKGTPESVPGFRGITSLFFTGGGSQASDGFYWTSNSPYLRPVDVTVRRAPKGFYPEKVWVPNPSPDTVNPPRNRLGYPVTLNLAPGAAGSDEIRDYSLYGRSVVSLSSGIFYNLDGSIQFPGGHAVTAAVPAELIVGTRNFSVSVEVLFDEVAAGANSLIQQGVVATGQPWFYFYVYSDNVVPGTGQLTWQSGPTNDVIRDPIRRIEAGRYYTVEFTRVGSTGTLRIDGVVVDSGSVPDNLTMTEVMSFGGAVGSNYFKGRMRNLTVSVSGVPWPVVSIQDANPAHIIFECLTNNDWGLGLPVAQLDVTSFTAAADTLYEEGLGLSMLWSNPSDLESFINDILGHIDGSYGIDPATGKIYLSLVRGGYSTEGLFELTPDNCKVTRFQRKSLSETVNEVVVTWTNPVNEQEETVTVHDLANYSLQGVLNSASSNYYGVRSASLATRLALRDLTRGAAPLASVEIDADRAAWSKKPGEVVLLTYPEYGLVQLPLRVMSVNYGRPGASKVQLSLVEDVFDTPDGAYVDISSSLEDNAVAAPTEVEHTQGGSAPYYLVSQQLGSSEASTTDADEAYTMILASSDTQLSSIELLVASTNALGTTEYVDEGSLVVSGLATLSAGLGIEASSSLAFSGFSGNVAPTTGGLVWIGSGDPKLSELALISTIGATLSVFRGVLDTTPKVWPVGTQIWFITPGLDAYDATPRLNGQTVNYKLIPSNPGGTLDPDGVQATPVLIDNRQHCPYRPANVKLNGVGWPALLEGTVFVTWSRRNRLLEDPVISQWWYADVTPEVGQTVTATLRRVDTDAVLAETTGITGTSVSLDSTYSGDVTLTLTSVRDGLGSYQPFVHPFTLVVSRKTEAGETRISESGETRILEN